MSTARNGLRSRLSVTTALVGGVIGIAMPARAQLPDMPNPSAGVTISVDGTAVLPGGLVNQAGAQLDVDLALPRSIIGWDSFSIGAGQTVNFNYAGTDRGAVLNRVTRVDPANISDIRGNITVNNVLEGPTAPLAVYLINPNGILFGGNAAVNVGALIASTLDQDAADDPTFLAGTSDLGRVTGTTGAVQLLGNARLSGTSGEVVLLGATVAPVSTAAVETEAGTSVTAATDAAFVVGSDVTITRTTGSPLAFTIASGTPVSANLVSAGNVNGRNVTLAIASRAGFTDALLVNGLVTATGVEASDRGVVLTAGASAPGVDVTVGPDTAGASSLAQNGGTIGSARDVIVQSGGDASLLGAVAADGGSYAVEAGGVVALGGAAQSAVGAVSVAAAGNIAGAAGLVLTANSDGTAGVAATEGVTLASGADIDFATGSSIVGGSTAASRTDIVVDQTGAGPATLRFGDVTGATFTSSILVGGAPVTTQGVVRDSALRFGTVTLDSAFALTTTGGGSDIAIAAATIGGDGQALTITSVDAAVTAPGTLRASGDVSVTANAALALGQQTSDAGSVTARSLGGGVSASGLSAVTGATIDAQGGDAAVTGAVAVTGATGAYAVTGTNVTLGTAGVATSQSAGGAVTLTARGAGAITGQSGLTLTADAGGDAPAEALTLAPGTGGIAFAGSAIVGGTSAGGTADRSADVLVGTAGPLTLGSVTARQLRTSDTVAAITRAGTITAGTLDLENALDLGATALSLGQITVRGGGQALTLATTTGALNAAGPLSAGGALSATSSAGGAVTLGDIVASASVLAQSSGAVTTGTIASSGTVTVRGGTVATGPIGTDPIRIGGDVELETTGGSLTAPEVFATGGVRLTASGDVTVPGRIAAGGAYAVTGNAVNLGVDGDAEVQSAGGAVTITARTGAITGGAGLTLQSGQAGAADVTLATQAAGAGFAFDAGSAVNAGTAATRGNLILATASPTGQVAFGSVRAAALQSQIGGAPATNGVVRPGAIGFASVNLNGGTLALTSSGGTVTVTTATVTGTGNGIALSGGNTVVADTLTAAGTVSVFGDSFLTVGALTSTGADVSAASSGSTGVTSASARAGSVTIRGGGDAAVTEAEGIDIAVDAAAGAATATTLAARDDIAVRAGGAITGGSWTAGATLPGGLGPLDVAGAADTLAGATLAGNGIDARGLGIVLGSATTGASSAALAGDLVLTATTDRLELGGGSVGRDARLAKQGGIDQLAVTGTLSVGTANAADPALLGTATIASTTAATLNIVTATGDLDAAATGALTLADGRARDILLRSDTGAIAATTLVARDDILVRPAGGGIVSGSGWTSGTTVGALAAVDADGVADAILAPGALAGRDIDVLAPGGIAIVATRAIGGGSDIRLDGPIVASATLDFTADADEDVTLTSAVAARDITLRGGNAVTAQALRARDDVLVTAGLGGLTIGAVTSGATVLGQGATDTEAGIGAFAGFDIELNSAGPLRFGALVSGDDIRINGSGGEIGFGDPLTDLSMAAPGDIVLAGNGVGRDIALAAGGTIAAGNLSARDDIALRARDAITTAVQTAGATIAGQGPTETGAGGAADALLGTLLPGNDVDGRANRLGVTTARAFGAGSDVRLLALDGALRLGSAEAGSDVTLTKQGAVDELVVTGSVVAGAQSVGDASGTIASATAVRLNAASALAGASADLVRDVIVTAAGEATGIAGAPVGDGRPLPGFGRIGASAARDALVSAGTTAQVGTLTAGRDAVVTASAGTAEVAGAVAAGGAYRVTGQSVRLGLDGGTVRQQADGLVRVVATGGGIAGVGALTLVANQDDTGAGAEALTLDATGGGIAFGAGTTLLGGATNRASNIGIRLATAGSDLTLGTVQARSLRETDAAGTAFGSLNTDGAISLLGDVSVRAGLRITTTGAIATRAITVTGFAGALQPLELTGASITVGGTLAAQGNVALTTTAGSLALTATPGRPGAVSEGGSVTIAVTGGGASGDGLRAAGSIGETVSGADTIAFADAGFAGTLLSEIDPNPDAGTPPPVGSDPLPGDSLPPVAGTQDVTIDAGSLTRTRVRATRDVSIRTAGNQTIGTIEAGRDVALNATGGTIAADGVTAGDDIAARAPAGTIGGTTWTTLGTVDAGGVADLLAGAALPGSDIDAIGTRIVLGTATATGLGSDLRLTGTAGRLELGTGSAGAAATLRKQGVAEELAVVTALTSGVASPDADATLFSTTAARLNSVTALTGNVAVTATGEATGIAGVNDARAILTAARATKSVTVDAGPLARLGLVTAGRDVRVSVAGAIDVSEVRARDIALAATTGALAATTLTARDDIAIRAGGAVTGLAWTSGATIAGVGPVDEAGVADTLVAPVDMAGNDIDVAGGSVTIGSATATGAGSDVRIAGLVAGGGTDGDLALTAGGAIALTGDASARDVALDAGGTVTTAAITARDDIAIRAGGAIVTGALASGVDAVDAAGAADALVAPTDLAGNDIDVAGASFAAPSATATGAGADLRLLARSGALTLDSGSAGGRARIEKRGATGELQAATLTTGLATPGADSDIVSATNIRLGTVEARTGTLTVTATGEVTGIGPDGRATLTTLGPDGDILVTAGPLVRLATVTAGRDFAATAAGTGPATIDLTSASAGRDIALSANVVTATTLAAGDDVAVRATDAATGLAWTAGATIGGTARLDAAGAADTLLAGIDLAGHDLDAEAGFTLTIGTVRAIGAGSDARLSGGARIVGGTAGGDLDVQADGDVTTPFFSLVFARDVAMRAGGTLEVASTILARDDVALRAGGQIDALPTVIMAGQASFLGGATDADGVADALVGPDTSLAGNDIDAVGRGIALFTASAMQDGAGDVRLTATADALSARRVFAGGLAALTKQGGAGALTAERIAAGLSGAGDARIVSDTAATIDTASAATDLAVTTRAGTLTLGSGAARDIALDAAGGDIVATTLQARDDIAIRATGTVTGTSWTSGTTIGGSGPVDAAGVADALLAGISLEGNDIDVAGSAITIDSATAPGTGSDVRLRAAVSSSGNGATDLAISTGGDIALSGAALGRDVALSAGGTITGTTITARDDIALRAGGAIALDTLASGAAIGGLGAVDVDGSADALLGTALLGNDIAAAAASFAANGATATGAGSDLRVTADAGALSLADGRAGGFVALLKQGDADALTATTLIAGLAGDADLTAISATAATIGSATASRDLAVSTLAGGLTLGTGGARDIALGATGGTLAATTLAARDDIAVRGSGAVTGTGWSSGVAPASDAAGLADALAGVALAGNDIDARGTAIALVRAGAAGAGSDLRLTATADALTLGDAETGGLAVLTKQGGAGELVVTGTLVAGGDARFDSATSVRLGTVESRGGAIAIVAPGGEVTGIGDGGRATLTAAGAIGITGGTLARLGRATAGGALGVTADRIDVTSATATNGALSLVADAGDVVLGTGAAGADATLDASGTIAVGTLVAGDAATARSTGATTIGTVRTTRGALAIEAARLSVGTAAAGGALTALARSGDAALTTASAGGAATVTTLGGDILVTTLNAGGAATFASASDARLGDVVATGGAVRVTAAAGEVTGIGAGAANLRSGSDQVLVTGGTLARLGTVDAGTSVDVAADTIAAGTATAAQALTLNAATGNVTLGAGSAGTTFELNAANEAQIGSGGVTVGGSTRTAANGAVIRANEVDLGGRLTAGAVLLVNRSAAGSATATMNLGDFAAATTTIAPTGGFDLSAAEINLIAAPQIAFAQTFGGATRDVRLGTLPLAASTDSARIDILSTGRIDVYGTIGEAGGAASAERVLRLGGGNAGTALVSGVAAIGTPLEGSRAALLVGTATTTGGGRILLTGTSTIDLRADRIAFGLTPGFLDGQNLALAGNGTGIDFQTVARRFISQPTSSLYNSTSPTGLAALAYADGANLLTATTLTVRYGDYALFQNTSQPFRANPNTGVTVGSFLSLASQGPSSGQNGGNGLALFGIINGLTGSSAALQGQAVIQTSATNPANTRINGCLIGSGGGGCLISAVATPVLNIFDEARANIFRTADDLAVQFDPVVGTNNESLFSDLGTIDFQFDEQKCDPASDSTCAKDNGTDQ